MSGFVDRARIDAVLAPWVPDPRDREFVTRCLLEEGPAHHRGANYVLLALLAKVVEAGGPVPTRGAGESVAIPLRLPPHVAEARDDASFALRMPTGPLDLLAPRGSPEHSAMAECLADGPPQHALANATIVCLVQVLLERAGIKA